MADEATAALPGQQVDVGSSGGSAGHSTASYHGAGEELAQMLVHTSSSKPDLPVREIWVKYNVSNLYHVDMAQQTFELRFNLEFTWEEPALNGHPVGQPVNWESIWRPTRVKFLNGRDVKFDPTYELCTWEKRLSGNAVVTCYGMVHGSFDESYELQDFPFDCQDCTVSVLLHSRTHRLVYKRNPDSKRKSSFDHSMVTLAEWETHDPDDEEILNPKGNSFNIYIRLKRKPNFIIGHLMFPIGLFSTTTWLAYACPAGADGVSSRLGVGLTMVLTSVAFKFAMAQDLPRLPYATHMDNYIMANMLMQLVVCFHVGVAGRMEVSSYADDVFALTSFLVAMMVQICFAVSSLCKAKREVATNSDRRRTGRGGRGAVKVEQAC